MSFKKQQLPKRVVIFRLGSLGDTLIALPALRLIAKAYPNAERRMITTYPPHSRAASSSSVLANTGLINGYYRYAYGTRNLKELFLLWWQIARWRPQVLVYLGGERTLQSAKRDAYFLHMCGVTKTIGVPVSEDMLYSRNMISTDGTQYREAEASRLARNISELGDADLENPNSWGLDLTKCEQARADEVLLSTENRPIIAVSVGTKMQSKDWGVDSWRLLLARIAERYPNYAVALCGAEDEAVASEYVADGWRELTKSPAVNLCGMLNTRESAAVFARSVVFLGHDSGPMHLAAAVQTPCVAIFSSRNIPRVWFPYGDRHRVLYHEVDCAGCGLVTCIEQQKKCILSITVDEVLSALNQVMQQAAVRV